MEPQQTRRFGSIPSATGGIARLACDRLRAAGKDLSTLLAAAGLTLEDIDDKTRRIEVSAQIKVLELAARELGDEYLGFRLATEFELGEIGLLYYVAASSERLAEALHDAERYSTIMNDGVRLRLSLQGATEIALSYENVDRQSDRHQIEFWLVALIRICRAVTGNRLAPRLVKLQHSRPGTPPEFRAFLGCDVEFAADADVIQFPLSYSSLPITGADIHLHKLLLNYADEALGRTSTQRDTTRSRVEDLVTKLLPHGRANVSEIARRLGMSRRSLSRALSAEGTTFSVILDQLRAALAERYIREEELPISQVAWLLGYGEISSFTHAFARWTGVPPSQFRNQGGAAIGSPSVAEPRSRI